MEKAFDRNQLKHIGNATKGMAQQAYDLCLYRCDEKVNETAAFCKQQCFKTIMVPFHMVKHQAHEAEENLYKQCLADRFPNISQKDYAECTKDIYAQRVELFMTHYANTAEKILSSIH